LRVAKLHRRGCPIERIAKLIGVSWQQIVYDIDTINKRYLKAQIKVRELHVADIEAKYDEALREAWKAWHRSKLDAHKRVEKQEPGYVTEEDEIGNKSRRPTGDMEVTEIASTTEGRLPNNAYMATILSILQAKRDLHGLDMPKKSVVTRLSIPFEEIAQSVPKEIVFDEIEQELKRDLEQLPQKPNQPQNGLKELPGGNGANHV